jgi:hypothetical protein
MCGMANATCTISECWYVTVVVVAGVMCGLINVAGAAQGYSWTMWHDRAIKQLQVGSTTNTIKATEG